MESVLPDNVLEMRNPWSHPPNLLNQESWRGTLATKIKQALQGILTVLGFREMLV